MKKKRFSVNQEKYVEVDIFLESKDENGTDYVIEVKNWEDDISTEEIKKFIGKKTILDMELEGLDKGLPDINKESAWLNNGLPGLEKEMAGLDKESAGLNNKGLPGLEKEMACLDKEPAGLNKGLPYLDKAPAVESNKVLTKNRKTGYIFYSEKKLSEEKENMLKEHKIMFMYGDVE